MREKKGNRRERVGAVGEEEKRKREKKGNRRERVGAVER
jgi:hypothetical protein